MPDGSGSFLVSFATGSVELLVPAHGGNPRITLTMIQDVRQYVAAALEIRV